ncbi:MAG: hypothetical protein H6600_03015 [Flavobacteriales bacterium]|nr:hypothetical protein [Flavobacteriales bacterium]
MKKLHYFKFVWAMFILMVIQSCSEKVTEQLRVNPNFSKYVSGYTSGVITKGSNIQIQLAQDYEGAINYDQPISEELFTFVPEISGKAYWISRNMIEFRPDNPLESGKQYDVHFDISKLIEVEDGYEDFSFNFKTISLIGDLYLDEIKTPDPQDLKHQQLYGRLVLSDVEDTTEIKKGLLAYQDGVELPIIWNFNGGLVHRFMVDGITRKDSESEVRLMWNGQAINSKYNDAVDTKIPALGDFKVTNIEVIHEPDQYVRVHFSDPIKAGQDLTGLITVDGAESLNYLEDGQVINVYYSQRLNGYRQVNVSSGIKNIGDARMKEGYYLELLFEGLKPMVKLLNNGVIAPHTPDGVQFPFEAVNLAAVDVYVTKVYENNILQFLQVNDLSGDYQMKRVSQEVYRQTILLNQNPDMNLHEWNKFFIDLSPIVNKDQGALYRVQIRFKKEYSVYGCDGDQPSTNLIQSVEPELETEWTEAGWDSYDYWYDYEYWDYYDEDYDYKERENPCNISYYSNKEVQANILASDIGIVAKAGGDKTMHIFLNNLLTTDPIAGATVEFYNYQQKLLGKATSDANGMCEAKMDEKPYVVIAKFGKQRGYLKLRDGEALSVSKFDVGGSYVQNGIKGFLYAERGVWRPGDSIYLEFMLEDKNDVIPATHPVTFTLYNPKNQVVDKKTLTKSVNGLYDFRTGTSQEALTGNYFAQVSIGNRNFSKVLKVETVKPNRLKIYLDFGKKLLTNNDENNKGKLSVKWLHGAVARNLHARVDMTLTKRYTTFSKFSDFIFDDPLKSFQTDDQTIFDSYVDDEGEASFTPSIYIGDNAPGMLKANFVTKVFEKGGDFSIDRSSIDYSPYDSYVGVNVPKGTMWGNTLVTDQEHPFEIATVDAEGNPLSVKNVHVQIYKLSWKWWWDSYNNDLASYIANTSIVPVYDKNLATVKGKAGFNFLVKKPDWGRYLIRVTDPVSGHTTGKIFYVDWPYEYRLERTSIENATMLSFSTDKETYNTGERVKVSFPSPSNGKAIIAIETGTTVLSKSVINTVKGETTYEFNTTADMAPNVYVHITLLQPHANTLNDAPIRMYGVAPIAVEDPMTHFSPVITMADVLKPETTTEIKVTEKTGKAMTYTLAIVDEGLLDLTSFKTPQPWDNFYAKEALGVKTWDMYDNVMGAFGSELQKLLAVGGDGSAEVKKPNKANRFEPMVRFVGPFTLPAKGTNVHKIDIPNYIGSVRVMLVAGQDAKYGTAEKTVPVRSPLMVLGTLPRVLSPTEEVYLPVNVFAMEEQIKDVTIEVSTNELLQIVGPKTKSMHFSKIGDEVENFKLKVSEKIGIAKVHIVVKSGKETAKYDVELDVRTPNPSVAEVYSEAIAAGDSWSPEFNFTGIEGTNFASVEISSFPPINLEQRLKYLVSYPHGCIEQTTSAAFPQLALDKVMNLSNDYKITIDQNIKAALDRLRLFQTYDGGFAYWPGLTDPSEWGSNYAGHFMLEAEAKGYKLPVGLKDSWLKYQKKMASNYKVITTPPQTRGGYTYNTAYYNDLTQSYRLYTLALANAADLGAMNRLRESQYLTLPAKWRLAAAYQLVGQTTVAQELVQSLSTDVPYYKELSYTYGSDIRDEAMILEALVLMKDKKAAGMAKLIAEQMNSNKYMSTQTTAYCLIAISKYLGDNKTSTIMNFSYAVNGKEVAVKNTTNPIFKNTVETSTDKNSIRIKNNGEGVLFAKLVVEGVPVIGDNSSASSNVNINIRYMDMERNEISPEQIEQGTDFIAQVVVSNPSTKGYLKEMTLNQLFPSGWEIHNNRMDGFQSTLTNSYYDYQDIRDDRVYTYYALSKGETKTYEIQLNATYLGKFYLPTVVTEAMYDDEIAARVGGRWVEVVKPRGN